MSVKAFWNLVDNSLRRNFSSSYIILDSSIICLLCFYKSLHTYSSLAFWFFSLVTSAMSLSLSLLTPASCFLKSCSSFLIWYFWDTSLASRLYNSLLSLYSTSFLASDNTFLEFLSSLSSIKKVLQRNSNNANIGRLVTPTHCFLGNKQF